MRIITATEASRHFSGLLDAVERGETVTIVRGSHPVAEIGPARRRTGADLRAALTGTPPPDDAFARSIAEAVSMVTSEVSDPWADSDSADYGRETGAERPSLLRSAPSCRATLYRRLAEHARAGRAVQVSRRRWRAVTTEEPPR
jgi:prevent-host-death family protein